VGHPVCNINLSSFDLLSRCYCHAPGTVVSFDCTNDICDLQNAAASLPFILGESISTNIRKRNLCLVHILFHLHHCKSIIFVWNNIRFLLYRLSLYFLHPPRATNLMGEGKAAAKVDGIESRASTPSKNRLVTPNERCRTSRDPK
jgi:hypothetical protein